MARQRRTDTGGGGGGGGDNAEDAVAEAFKIALMLEREAGGGGGSAEQHAAFRVTELVREHARAFRRHTALLRATAQTREADVAAGALDEVAEADAGGEVPVDWLHRCSLECVRSGRVKPLRPVDVPAALARATNTPSPIRLYGCVASGQVHWCRAANDAPPTMTMIGGDANVQPAVAAAILDARSDACACVCPLVVLSNGERVCLLSGDAQRHRSAMQYGYELQGLHTRHRPHRLTAASAKRQAERIVHKARGDGEAPRASTVDGLSAALRAKNELAEIYASGEREVGNSKIMRVGAVLNTAQLSMLPPHDPLRRAYSKWPALFRVPLGYVTPAITPSHRVAATTAAEDDDASIYNMNALRCMALNIANKSQQRGAQTSFSTTGAALHKTKPAAGGQGKQPTTSGRTRIAKRSFGSIMTLLENRNKRNAPTASEAENTEATSTTGDDAAQLARLERDLAFMEQKLEVFAHTRTAVSEGMRRRMQDAGVLTELSNASDELWRTTHQLLFENTVRQTIRHKGGAAQMRVAEEAVAAHCRTAHRAVGLIEALCVYMRALRGADLLPLTRYSADAQLYYCKVIAAVWCATRLVRTEPSQRTRHNVRFVAVALLYAMCSATPLQMMRTPIWPCADPFLSAVLPPMAELGEYKFGAGQQVGATGRINHVTSGKSYVVQAFNELNAEGINMFMVTRLEQLHADADRGWRQHYNNLIIP